MTKGCIFCSFFCILSRLATIINQLDATMSNEREEEERKKRKAMTLLHLRFFSSLLTIEEKNKLSLQKTFSLFLSLYRCLPPSTPPPLSFKDYQRLGAISNVETYMFSIIVIEL